MAPHACSCLDRFHFLSRRRLPTVVTSGVRFCVTDSWPSVFSSGSAGAAIVLCLLLAGFCWCAFFCSASVHWDTCVYFVLCFRPLGYLYVLCAVPTACTHVLDRVRSQSVS